MSPAQSAFLGLSVGLVAYFAAATVGGDSRSAVLGDTLPDTSGGVVSESLAPGAKQVTGGAKPSVTKLAQGDKSLAPTPTPSVTTVAQVTPRPTTAYSATPTPTATSAPSATPTPVVPRANTPTPSPTAAQTPTATLSATPTPTPEPTPTPTPTSTPTPTPVVTSRVVINEVAWAGTATSSTDEWMELFNAGDGSQSLEGWFLCAGADKVAQFGTTHTIAAGAYFLMERTDDSTISDISGDYVGPFSKPLVDGGLHLTLRSGNCTDGAIIDEVGPGTWYAGNGGEKASMERISADSPGNDASNWATWGTIPDPEGNVNSTGLDAAGQPIKGTPKYNNSVSH